MRMSDWSSDVCSSDLIASACCAWRLQPGSRHGGNRHAQHADAIERIEKVAHNNLPMCEDRKSVVSGKSVSVRVDLGGRRIINKQSKHTKTPTQTNQKNTR